MFHFYGCVLLVYSGVCIFVDSTRHVVFGFPAVGNADEVNDEQLLRREARNNQLHEIENILQQLERNKQLETEFTVVENNDNQDGTINLAEHPPSSHHSNQRSDTEASSPNNDIFTSNEPHIKSTDSSESSHIDSSHHIVEPSLKNVSPRVETIDPTAPLAATDSNCDNQGSGDTGSGAGIDPCPVSAALPVVGRVTSLDISDQENVVFREALFIAVVAGCSVAGLVGLVVAGVCWYKLQKNVKAASEVEYPAYGHTNDPSGKDVPPGPAGDRKLAQSAQMYHYQHQKQQMIAMEKASGEMKQDGSEDDTDDENEEGDYTVYECPGLAPTGEMEVKNPLFNEDTPVTPTGDDRGTEEEK